MDIVKFICKEFWEELFKKKIDKLQTNHRGIFVLSDYRFKWLEKYSQDETTDNYLVSKLLNFPCGLLKGAMANLGIAAIVTADPIFSSTIGCSFNIKIKSNS